jgi:hypothetical protein
MRQIRKTRRQAHRHPHQRQLSEEEALEIALGAPDPDDAGR